jgi:hypothetical protein
MSVHHRCFAGSDKTEKCFVEFFLQLVPKGETLWALGNNSGRLFIKLVAEASTLAWVILVKMSKRNLPLFTLILACLTHPAPSCGQDSNNPPSDEILRESKPTDFNRNIYYKNKLEFSLETGWLPINIPWPFDVFVGDQYNVTGLNYTLVPTLASLRWQMNDVGGPWILRGNWDLTASGAFTAIPRGPETHYEAFDMGIRRNFVRRNWRIAPYFDLRLGAGRIDAKGPLGVPYAQGQDFTFTFMMGSGVRYNLNSRYAISAGINFMHVSNLYLSEPRFLNYGINVYGPMVGFDIRLGKPKRWPEQQHLDMR